MGEKIDFSIAHLPKTTNAQSSLHWRTKGKLVKDIHGQVRMALVGARIDRPFLKAKVVCHRFSSVAPDYDGLVSSFKHVIDALVVYGVIEDDSLDHIGMPEFRWFKAKPKQGYIRVIIEEVRDEV